MNSISLGMGDYITVWYISQYNYYNNIKYVIKNKLKNIYAQIFCSITSTAVSIAAASAPSASLTLMPLVLNAIGAPVQDIGLLFAIDWLWYENL